MKYYKDINTDINRYEFINSKYKQGYHRPHQLFLRNWISKNTLNDNVLLYHALGSGKTCTAISIAEGFKEFVQDTGRKIIVITKNKDIRENFEKELLTQCTRGEYISNTDSQILKQPKPVNTRERAALNALQKDIKEKTNSLVKKVYRFLTYGEIKYELDFNNTIVIVDEAHNLKAETYYKSFFDTLSKSYNYRLVLMTGTPVFDNAGEILLLSNLLNSNDIQYQLHPGQEELLTVYGKETNVDSDENAKYIDFTELGITKLKESLKGKVSYVPPDVSDTPKKIIHGEVIPNTDVKVIKCIMSKYQAEIYKLAYNNAKDSLKKIASDAATVVYPGNSYDNSTVEEEDMVDIVENINKYSCKISKMIDTVKTNKGKHFIYSSAVSSTVALLSNFLLANDYEEFYYENGVSSSGLNSKKLRFIVLTGESASREKILERFNEDKNKHGDYIKVVIGSSVVSEGISFKHTKYVHILEPHWNLSKINQVIGRAVRLGSHRGLSDAEKITNVYKYIAVQNEIPNIDEEKYMVSYKKSVANSKVNRLLKEVSIDCLFNADSYKEYIKDLQDNSEECDHTKCKIKCMYKPMPSRKDTYELYLEFFDEFDFALIKRFILKLFTEYFVWRLDRILELTRKEFGKISTRAVYITLDEVVTGKQVVKDMYGREGVIISRSDLYIFSPSNQSVDSSIYSKMFDFNEYRDSILLPISVHETPQNTTPSVTQDAIQDEFIDKKLYMTVSNGKNKLVDNRYTDDTDKRKKNTGKVFTSFKKEDLVEIYNYIKLNEMGTPIKNVSSDRKGEYINAITEYLESNNLVAIL